MRNVGNHETMNANFSTTKVFTRTTLTDTDVLTFYQRQVLSTTGLIHHNGSCWNIVSICQGRFHSYELVHSMPFRYIEEHMVYVTSLRRSVLSVTVKADTNNWSGRDGQVICKKNLAQRSYVLTCITSQQWPEPYLLISSRRANHYSVTSRHGASLYVKFESLNSWTSFYGFWHSSSSVMCATPERKYLKAALIVKNILEEFNQSRTTTQWAYAYCCL